MAKSKKKLRWYTIDYVATYHGQVRVLAKSKKEAASFVSHENEDELPFTDPGLQVWGDIGSITDQCDVEFNEDSAKPDKDQR
jgi:hypothetical protein